MKKTAISIGYFNTPAAAGRALDEPVAEILAQPDPAIALDTASIVHFKGLRNNDFPLSPAPLPRPHEKRSTTRHDEHPRSQSSYNFLAVSAWANG
jgi:hypothetical protein